MRSFARSSYRSSFRARAARNGRSARAEISLGRMAAGRSASRTSGS